MAGEFFKRLAYRAVVDALSIRGTEDEVTDLGADDVTPVLAHFLEDVHLRSYALNSGHGIFLVLIGELPGKRLGETDGIQSTAASGHAEMDRSPPIAYAHQFAADAGTLSRWSGTGQPGGQRRLPRAWLSCNEEESFLPMIHPVNHFI